MNLLKSSSILSILIRFQEHLIFGCLVFLLACKPTTKKPGTFHVLPSPQQFEISGVSALGPDDIKFYFSEDGSELPVTGPMLGNIQAAASASGAQIIISKDEELKVKPEGYNVDISSKQIIIAGKDGAGLLYGLMTLEQLMEDAADQDVNLPVCQIVDYPLLALRAIHIDVKHHLEKTDYYYRLMDRLAKYKINAIIAEVEDKIGYVRQPAIGSADAITIEEWQKLSDYAKERNIEISPLVQGLGHASFILKHDAYKELRDDPESDWAFNPLDPKTYEVQFDLYLDAIEATPHGKYLHVGGDEVHTTGRGSGQSPLELQLDWLNKVCQFAEEHGRIPIFWDDMPLKHASVYRPMFDETMAQQKVDQVWSDNEHKLLAFLDQFPKNCIYMRWNYQKPGTYGNLKAMDWFISNGFQSMGATAGQTRWTLMPQNESNIENIRSFALSSIEKGLHGLLLTLWDDDSPHFELYMRGIIAFAEYTWSGDKRSREELKEVHMQRAFGYLATDSKRTFIDDLEGPVGAWKNALLKEGQQRNNLISMEQPLEDGVMEIPVPDQKGKWTEEHAELLKQAKEMLTICDSISLKIGEIKKATTRNSYTLEVYEQVNELVQFTFRSLLALETYDSKSTSFDSQEAFNNLKGLSIKFENTRSQFEEVYGKTRILEKPSNYLLDQDHHRHSANQTTSFNWQFMGELMFLEKLKTIE